MVIELFVVCTDAAAIAGVSMTLLYVTVCGERSIDVRCRRGMIAAAMVMLSRSTVR